jgi:hypothetical protein
LDFSFLARVPVWMLKNDMLVSKHEISGVATLEAKVFL